MAAEGSQDPYGRYIQATGGKTALWEAVFSRYILESRFKNRQRIVELGPGRCTFVRLAPDRIVAVDNSRTLVETYAAEGLDIRLGSAASMPLADQAVDGAYACWLFEHLSDPLGAAREIHRVLKPGGVMCLIVPSANALLRGFYDDYTHVRPYTAASLRQLAQAAGFGNWKIEYLFWTRGVRRLVGLLSEARLVKVLQLLDGRVRNLGIMNRDNLVLEAWK